MQYEFPNIIMLPRISMNMIKTRKPNTVYAFAKKFYDHYIFKQNLVKVYPTFTVVDEPCVAFMFKKQRRQENPRTGHDWKHVCRLEQMYF